jgi:hypothetical protein
MLTVQKRGGCAFKFSESEIEKGRVQAFSADLSKKGERKETYNVKTSWACTHDCRVEAR